MDVSEIVDNKSFAAWLEETNQPREVCVALAHRSAMRVLPIAWGWFARSLKDDLTVLPILRCALISSGKLWQKISVEIIADAAAHAARDAEIVTGIDSDDYWPYPAAYAATTAPAAAYSGDFAAYAANAAGHAGRSIDVDVAFEALRADCLTALAAGDLYRMAIWPDVPADLNAFWLALVQDLRSEARRVNEANAGALDWSYFVEFYERALDAKPQNDALIEAVISSDEIDWDKPVQALGVINRMWRESRISETIDLFSATLFQFSFDKIAKVMRAVPLDEDWGHLEDPEALKSFLEKADDLTEGISLFCSALEAEGTAMQGAGTTRTYFGAVLKEMEKARDVGKLRVSKLLEWGRILENLRSSEETQKEFGVLAQPLKENVDSLLNLVRDHFAKTLVRFAPLRELALEDDANPWEVLLTFRDILDAVAKGEEGERPPLAEEDVAVLKEMLESVDRLLRAMEAAHGDGKASFKRELEFQLAKVGATTSLFAEQATSVFKTADKSSDELLRYKEKVTGLGTLGAAIQKYLNG